MWPSLVDLVEQVEIFWAPGQARIQIVYFESKGVRFGVGDNIPEFDSQLELKQFLEGFFYEKLDEPNDTTRGLWVDGVWWWSPGTIPIEPPQTGGLVLVRHGAWVSDDIFTTQQPLPPTQQDIP